MPAARPAHGSEHLRKSLGNSSINLIVNSGVLTKGIVMTLEYYESIRAKLYGGHKQNPFAQLLKDRAGIRGPIQGTPEEFSQILFELTRGELDKRSETVTYEVIGSGKKNVLKYVDGSPFSVVKAKGGIAQSLIIITPYTPSRDDLLSSHEMPLAHLAFEILRVREAYTRVAGEYKRYERKLEAEKAAEERRITRESTSKRHLRQ